MTERSAGSNYVDQIKKELDLKRSKCRPRIDIKLPCVCVWSLCAIQLSGQYHRSPCSLPPPTMTMDGVTDQKSSHLHFHLIIVQLGIWNGDKPPMASLKHIKHAQNNLINNHSFYYTIRCEYISPFERFTCASFSIRIEVASEIVEPINCVELFKTLLDRMIEPINFFGFDERICIWLFN